jgi:hypothetical protein
VHPAPHFTLQLRWGEHQAQRCPITQPELLSLSGNLATWENHMKTLSSSSVIHRSSTQHWNSIKRVVFDLHEAIDSIPSHLMTKIEILLSRDFGKPWVGLRISSLLEYKTNHPQISLIQLRKHTSATGYVPIVGDQPDVGKMCHYLEWVLNVDPVTLKEFEEMIRKDLLLPSLLPSTKKSIPPPAANPFLFLPATRPLPL